MQADTKQLTADEVLAKLDEIHEFSEKHPDEWRNEVARDLNQLIGRAVWYIETDRDDVDITFGNSVIRIVKRVAEFEEIKKDESKPI
jgi:ABC-type nitrate/sulfonate/bicarbonate transport system substrate-binding protein